MALEDVERIDALVDEGAALQAAFRVNAAFAKPETLTREWQQYRARLRRPVSAGDVSEREKDALRDLLTAIREANAARAAGEPLPVEVS